MVKSKVGTVEPVTNPENGDWNHRSQLSVTEEDKAVSQEIEERRHGKMEYPAVNEEEQDASEIHPDHDKKPTSQKYREKYSKYWSDETKEKAKELYKERGDVE